MVELECCTCGYRGWGTVERVENGPITGLTCRIQLFAWCRHQDAHCAKVTSTGELAVIVR